ncbi:MAG: carbohydrate kinase [Micrococcales bacterium 70-64]|nr:carbohydrate kinase [Leifsonia sp.]ODU63912.1 MAG: carbohydrate kinase [Leifsonia sp. SCN 70-46]OJX85603.1 MAG: carbohydrate kinase [Micrococcales bacterium 70-64]
MTLLVPSNRPPARFYRGGARITAFRGEPPAADREPEDWVGSTTTIAGEERLGLTTLPDGRLLRDAVAADPEHWLGREHVARFGDDVRLLVKLLDAGQRLPVHAHPSDEWAAGHLGHAHGKAEAWYILEGGTVHVGLREDVDAAALRDLVERQDTAGLLALLHEVEVAPGDVVWVPPGELHAIGAGVFLLELQQPEDLSILLEWEGFALDGARDGHLGVGFDTALGAVNLRARRDVSELVGTIPGAGSMFPVGADQYFRLDRVIVDGHATLDRGFAILVVADGELSLEREGDVALVRGATAIVPAAAGHVRLRGSGTVLVCRPPAP